MRTIDRSSAFKRDYKREAGREEQQAKFDAEAEARNANLIETGKSIAWAEMRRYLEARALGEAATMPAARKLAP